MTKTFKPMLASPADLDAVRYPVFASPKLDGIRASVVGGRLLTRTLKEVPSRHVFNMLSKPEFEGLDGELIVGAPTNSSCYRNTVSMVMADSKVFSYTYYVFDKWDVPSPFSSRRLDLISVATHDYMEVIKHVLLQDRDMLDRYEAEQISLGHEGIMLADPNARYKFGRATTESGELLKVKRFVDSEAEIIGIEEEMHNANEAQTSELGRTKRSTAQAGLIGKGTMGALIVRDVKTGVEFKIGTGFTATDRESFWQARDLHIACKTPIKYKFFPIGVKDKPRHPVFLGLRPRGA